MAITKNLIHFNEKTKFEEKLANNEILDTSIVFIKDTQEIYTHGQLYKCADPDLSIYLTTTNAGNTYATITTANGLQENIDDVITDLQDYKTTVASTYITPNEVDTKIAALVDSAPTTLDTLNELAAALGDDPNFATTVATNIGKKADQSALDNTNAKFNNYLPLTGGRLKGELKINTEAETDNQKFGFFKTDNSNQNNYGCLQVGTNVGLEKPIGITLSGCDPTLTANGTDKYALCVVGLGKGYTTQELKDLTRNSDKTERCRVVVNGNLLMENGKIIGTANAADSVPWTGVTGRPTSLPASDVYAWAKKASLALEDVPDLSSKYLPLSGGTLTGNGAGILTVNRQDGNPVIEFRHNGSLKGRYGFATDGTPIGVVAGSQVTLVHSGNIGNQNAGSATKLQTARTLWGQPFDGTADVAAQLTFNANNAALAAWKKDGSNTSIFLQVNPDRHLLIGQGTARENGGLYLYGNDIRMCYGNAGSSSNTSMLINSSGNVTIGSSDTAGADYKLRVDGKSRFTDRVSVASLRIVPVNGSYAADFAIDGSSLTLNRELKFTNVTASDICSGIAAAFKTSLAQAENLIARNIILGASSGSASNLALSFQKYTSVSNTAPNGLTTLMTLTTDGNLGIGTVNPEYKLDVAGTMIANTYRKRTASSNRALCAHDGESLIFGDTTNLTFLRGSEIVFQPVVGQRVATITSTGLGIGTASPEYKLDVVGKARVSDELIVTNPTGFRWAYGDYGVLFRNDANKFYVLLTDAGGALSGSWNALRPFAISLTTGDVTMEHNLDVNGNIKSSSIICGTTRLRVNSPTNGGVFGYMDAQLFQNTNNVSSVHIGSCYGGNSTIDDTTESPNGVSMTAISIYRGRVGIGKRWSDTELRALHDANCSLGVWNNAHIMGNLAVSSIYSDNGQSGAAGVVLRNEGGIEITHASTPYIDFHNAAGTSDFSMRLVARTDKTLSFSCSDGAFCPYTNGSESLGTSSYRWNILWVSGINVSGNTDVGGALTVGAGAAITGAVTIDGETAATQTWVTSQGYKTTDNNTTYTFTGGTNEFTVTPSNGSAQTVTITPSITGITAGTGLTGGGTSGKVTLGLTSTYQTYISNGNTAYGWGNHSGKYLPIGGGTCTGAITATAFYQSSDETLKVFGDDISIDFNALKRIPKKYFNWKDGDGTIEIGTGAQSLQKVYPELVTESNGHLVVAYDKLSIIALKAIDVLHAENQELKNRLTKLEEMVYGNRN